MMIKGVLFDKDGTLIEFVSMWHQILKHIFIDLEEQLHLSKEIIVELQTLSGFEEKGFKKESMIQYCSTTEIINQWYETILKYDHIYGITKDQLFEKFEINAVKEDIKVQLLDGVEDLLLYLYNKGYYLGVATADTKDSTSFNLRMANIDNYFSYVGTDGKNVEAKPSPQMAIDFCNLMNISPDELLIVGDSVTDMLFAKNTGAHFIGIKTAYNDSKQFIENDYSAVNDIYEIIKEFNL